MWKFTSGVISARRLPRRAIASDARCPKLARQRVDTPGRPRRGRRSSPRRRPGLIREHDVPNLALAEADRQRAAELKSPHFRRAEGSNAHLPLWGPWVRSEALWLLWEKLGPRTELQAGGAYRIRRMDFVVKGYSTEPRR